MIDNHVNDFLKELTELTKKYKLSINGCGCCGSPSLEKIQDEESSSNFGYKMESRADPKELTDLKYTDLKASKG